MEKTAYKPTIALALTTALLLAGCGGGSSGTATVSGVTPTPTATGSQWQAGVFEPSVNFKNRCAAPRTGTNPATGGAFPDIAGSATDEMMFLRSFSDDTYLWYSELPDLNPALYSDVLQYFDLLTTSRTDEDGQPIDRFHFTYDSQDWYELSQTGVSAGYGITFILESPVPPREIIVGFVEPVSAAATAQVARGERVVRVDGVDIDTGTDAGIDVLNGGLFPSSPGETHTLTLAGPTGTTRTVSLQSSAISIDPVPVTQVITLEDQTRVGYLLFNDHIATAELALIDAVNELNAGAGIDELVLDVRYNGGGFLAIASQLSYMIAGTDATVNETFELLQFNDKHPTINPITGQFIQPTPFYSNALGPPFNAPAGMPLPTFDIDRVFVLVGSNTCSASEAIINGLRGINFPVEIVGTRTCGKPYGFYAEDNCGTTYFTVQFQGVNAQGEGDYPNGFVPDNASDNVGVRVPGCSVADDYGHDLGDEDEDRLRTALNLIRGQGCPVSNGARVDAAQKVSAPLRDGQAAKPVALQNRIALP